MDKNQVDPQDLEDLGLKPQRGQPKEQEKLVIQLAKKVKVLGRQARYLQMHTGPNRRQRRFEEAEASRRQTPRDQYLAKKRKDKARKKKRRKMAKKSRKRNRA